MSIIDRAIKYSRNINYDNPIVTKEMRSQMRAARAYWWMAGYVVLLSIVLISAYIILGKIPGAVSSHLNLTSDIGHKLFSALTWAQAVITTVIAIGLTAGSITSEYKQNTIEALALTHLTPRNIVAGKTLSAMAFITLLLGCSLPITGVCFLMGGVSPLEVVMSYISLWGWAFFFAALGVTISALLKKTSTWNHVLALFIAYEYAPKVAYLSAVNYMTPKGSWHFIFSGLCAGAAADHSLSMAPVFGLQFPVYLIGFLVNVAMGIFMLTFAMTKIDYYVCRKPLETRVQILGMSLIGMLLLFGNLAYTPSMAGIPIGSTQSLILLTFIVLMMIGGVLLPLFSTGPVPRDKSIYASLISRFNLRSIFVNDAVGGVRFLVVWFAAGLAVITLSLILSQIIPGPWPTQRINWVTFIGTIISLAVTFVAMASIGLMFSTLLKDRIAAMVITGLVLIMFMVAVPTVAAAYTWFAGLNPWPSSKEVFWQLAYLWPGTSVGALTDFWIQGKTVPHLWLPKNMAWIGCAVVWAVIGAAALTITNLRLKRPGGIRYNYDA